MDFSNFPFDEMEAQAQGIFFDYDDTDFELDAAESVEKWIQKIVEDEGKTLGELNYIFCSDAFLHKINVEYLDHDTLTDIITFPLADDAATVAGEMYISVERVADNAKDFGVSFTNELHRVVIHGVLHLCGYGDKTEAEEKNMRKKEEESLKKRNFQIS